MPAGPPLLPPASPAVSSAPEQLLTTIGDIGVSPSWIVTPNGSAPIAGSVWIANDQSRQTERIPPYAIVLAIIFAFACLLGLFFLLIKERTTTGYVEVSVRSGTLYHVTQVPVTDHAQVAHIRQLVAYAQSLAAR